MDLMSGACGVRQKRSRKLRNVRNTLQSGETARSFDAAASGAKLRSQAHGCSMAAAIDSFLLQRGHECADFRTAAQSVDQHRMQQRAQMNS